MSSYTEVNRAGWEYLSRNGCDSSLPYGPTEWESGRVWLDPKGWIPWHDITSVLCLACGGGQQGPMFASLGYKVTVVDLSPEQLDLDRSTAEQHGLQVECIEADIADLSQLYGRHYDLVYQAVSACYLPNVRVLYDQVYRVLKEGGLYRVEHWTPFQMQLPQYGSWDGSAYRMVTPQTNRGPVQWREWDEKGNEKPTCWHYIHSLNELIGKLCDAGFTITRFGETQSGDLSAAPGTHPHLAAYVPPFFSMLSQRSQKPRNSSHE
jgi:SAM-dependent methyltransferase